MPDGYHFMKIYLKELEIILSNLEDLPNPKPELEQWTTLPRIAAEMLMFAYQMGDITGKVCADLGCGSGVLTAGLLILGAETVYAVDIDIEAIETTRKNIERISEAFGLPLKNRIILMHCDVRRLNKISVDTVVMNPPFGVEPQTKHADRYFLLKAFEIARVVYSLYYSSLWRRRSLERSAREHGFESKLLKTFDFSLYARFPFHKRKLKLIKVDFYMFRKETSEA